jgi:hypothetical protein
MPSVKQSARVNMDAWRPVDNTPKQAEKGSSTPAPPDLNARSPYMLSSMPLMASTGDAFAKQFYSNANTPSQRIMPAKKGAGA